jgi:hypothetical protein
MLLHYNGQRVVQQDSVEALPFALVDLYRETGNQKMLKFMEHTNLSCINPRFCGCLAIVL